MKTLADRLRYLRNDLGLTQKELMGLSGISSMHISHFESGRRLPNIQNAIKLCVALNCSMDWLTRGIRCGNE